MFTPWWLLLSSYYPYLNLIVKDWDAGLPFKQPAHIRPENISKHRQRFIQVDVCTCDAPSCDSKNDIIIFIVNGVGISIH